MTGDPSNTDVTAVGSDERRRRLPSPLAVLPAAVAWIVAVCLPLVAGTWWPIAASDGVLEQRATTFGTDWISFAPLPDPWVLQPWVPALVLRGVHEIGGVAALSMLSAAGWATVLVLVRRTSITAGAGSVPATVAALALLPLLWPLLLETQLFAVLLVALLTHLLWRGRWWLAPLVIVAWANSHGSAPAGPLLCAAAALGAVSPSIPPQLRRYRVRAAWVAACMAALLASPLGVELFSYIRDVGAVEDLEALTPAWERRALASPTSAWIVVTAAIAVAGILLAPRERRLGRSLLQVALLVVLAAAALSAQRHSVWFAVVVAPQLALAFDATWRRRGWTLDPRSRLVEASIGAGIVVLAIAVLPGTPLQRSLSTTGLPSDDLLERVDSDDAVYAPINVADHVVVSTGAQVFVDARLERYPRTTLREQLRLAGGDLSIVRPADVEGRTLVLVADGDERLGRAARTARCLRLVDEEGRHALYELEPGIECR